MTLSSLFEVLSDLATAAFDAMPSPEWHNAFGTLADYQVPAEDPFSSFDPFA